MAGFDYKEHSYGFEWGPLDITRCASAAKWGVMVELATPRQRLIVRVTPSGLLRLSEFENNAKAKPGVR